MLILQNSNTFRINISAHIYLRKLPGNNEQAIDMPLFSRIYATSRCAL